MAAADFDHDGHVDLVWVWGTVGLGSSKAFAVGKPALSGALGDFSGSGNLDAVVNVAAAQALLLHGNGDGTFAALATPTAMKVSASAAVTQVGPCRGRHRCWG
jgi:hypothetical protein